MTFRSAFFFLSITLALGATLIACLRPETTSTVPPALDPPTVVFRDDFENGLLEGWAVEPAWSRGESGWAVKPSWSIEDDGGNKVLHSQVDAGDFSRVSLEHRPTRGLAFRDFTVQARFKLLSGGASLLFRHNPNEPERGFYDITFRPDAVELARELNGSRRVLASASANLDYARWYTLTVTGDSGTLTVRLDQVTIITHDDKGTPVLAGGVSVENRGHIHLDDVTLWLDVPPGTGVTWSRTGPMPAGEAWAISFAPARPSIVYLATRMNNAFRSEDSGLTWRPVAQLGAHIFAPVAVYPNNANIIFVSNGVIHRSDDGGRTLVSGNMKGSAFIVSIAISRTNPDIIYAADIDRTIYKTQNGGREWNAVGVLPGQPAAGTLLVNPLDPASLLVAVRGAGIYASGDGGVNWSRLLSVSPLDQSLIMDPANPRKLFVVGKETVYRTTDGGTTWVPLRSSPHVSSLAISAAASARLYISGADGVYRSDDGGESWSRTTYNGDTFGRFPVLAVSPANADLVFAATEHGVALSTDGGLSWSWRNSGLTDYDAWQLAASPRDPRRMYAGTFCMRGIFQTSDAGANWRHVPEHFHYVMEIATARSAPETIWVTEHNGLYHSTDAGNTWRHVGDTGAYHLHGLAVDPVDPGTVYVGATGGVGEYSAPYATIYKTADGGRSWTEINSGLPRAATSAQAIVVDPTSRNTVYVATYREGLFHTEGSGIGIYKSTSGGQSWKPINRGLASLNVASLAVDPSAPQTLYAGTDRGLFVTTNGGEEWTIVSSAPKVLINAMVPDETAPGTLYIATEQAGVFRTVDWGKSWVSLNMGLPFLPVGDLWLDTANGVLYTAVRGGYTTTAVGGVYVAALPR